MDDFNAKDDVVNFGGGIELLMNSSQINKQNKSSAPKTDNFSLDDITELENELSDLATFDLTSHNDDSNLFGEKKPSAPSSHSFEEKEQPKKSNPFSNIFGISGKSEPESSKTWDGFSKVPAETIPTGMPQPSTTTSYGPIKGIGKEGKKPTDNELWRFLKKYKEKGGTFSKEINEHSTYVDKWEEAQAIKDEKDKTASIEHMKSMVRWIIGVFEKVNSKFNPFDIELDGWSEQIEDAMEDPLNTFNMDDIFEQLYYKYKDIVNLSPEIAFIFKLGMSAAMVHWSNSMLKSQLPNADVIFKENPELMQAFQSAAMNTLGKQSPGYAQFMNGVMGTPSPQMPPPIPARQPVYEPRHQEQQQTRYENVPPPRSSFEDRPKSMYDDRARAFENQPRSTYEDKPNLPLKTKRKDMSGPNADVSNILSGLKTKVIRKPEEHIEKNINLSSSANDDNDFLNLDFDMDIPPSSETKQIKSKRR